MMIIYLIVLALFLRYLCPFSFISAAIVMLRPSALAVGGVSVTIVTALASGQSSPLEVFVGGMAAFSTYSILCAL